LTGAMVVVVEAMVVLEAREEETSSA
jgi:hypothetical protein